MGLKFQLELGDFLALAGFMFLSFGANYVTTGAQIQAESNKIVGELKLTDQKMNSGQLGLSEKFDQLSLDVGSRIEAGLEARSNEIALGISKLSGVSENVWVSIANMKVGGVAYQGFVDLSEAYGSDTNLFVLQNVAYGRIELDSLTDLKAQGIQNMIAAISPKELIGLQVSIGVGLDFIDENNPLYLDMMRAEIVRLQNELRSKGYNPTP